MTNFDLRTEIIRELMLANDEMKFDLAGNDFAYLANRLMSGPLSTLLNPPRVSAPPPPPKKPPPQSRDTVLYPNAAS